MADKKKQHYVPKFYMRKFLYDDNRFYLYNVINKKTYGLVPYKDQCYKDYFYGKDKNWEDKLSVKENNWEESFKRFISGDYSEDVIRSLKEFAVFQKGRTIEQVEKQIDIYKEVFFHELKIIIENDDSITKNKEDYYKEAKKQAYEKAKQKMTPNALLDIFEKIDSYIDDLAFAHIKFFTKEKLISSDNPIIMTNNFVNNVGFSIIGLIIMFPVSKTDFVVFYDQKVYSKLKNGESIVIKNEYIVKKFNEMIFCNSKDLIYSSNDFKKYLFNSNLYELWKKNHETKCVSTISSPKDAMIITHYPCLQYPNDIYFFKIDSKYECVNKDFRTPVSRKFDLGYNNKLKGEMSYIPKVLLNNKDDVINDEYIEKYTEGHKKYYLLMQDYWNVSND